MNEKKINTPGARREFIQQTAWLAASFMLGTAFTIKEKKPLLSFSTLGCPDWNFQQIVDFAVTQEYSGIELRGLQRQMELSQCKEFSNPANITATLKVMKNSHLKFVDLGSSVNLHLADPVERKKNLDEGRRYIDLASALHCPFIRVFPNNFPVGKTKEETKTLIVKGLLELGDYAKDSSVKVLIESHGDLLKIDDLESVLQAAEHPNVGMVWDIVNMWTITRESPVMAYERLKQYIHHTHIKDANINDGKIVYSFLGQGNVPVFQGIDALAKGGYKGYYSFEWEKLWHPELAAPELAFEDYSKTMRAYFKKF